MNFVKVKIWLWYKWLLLKLLTKIREFPEGPRQIAGMTEDNVKKMSCVTTLWDSCSFEIIFLQGGM